MLNSLETGFVGVGRLRFVQIEAWARRAGACLGAVLLAAEFSLLAQSSPSNAVTAAVEVPAVMRARANGRRHPSYTVLSNGLPQIMVESGRISVGGKVTISATELSALRKEDLENAAAVLEITSRALDAFISRASAVEKPNPEILASELKDWVLDYLYLHRKWLGYGPPKVSPELRQKGLQLLESGQLDEVWALEAALPPPATPTLRLVD
jgi:hypothetical protein